MRRFGRKGICEMWLKSQITKKASPEWGSLLPDKLYWCICRDDKYTLHMDTYRLVCGP